MSDLADFLHVAISHELLGGIDVLEAYAVCMLVCMHVHAHMQISHGASTKSFNYVILELHAKNQVSMTMDVLIISL